MLSNVCINMRLYCVFFSRLCALCTPVATVTLQSAVPGRRCGKPQSAWWSPAYPHYWRMCWSTACLQGSTGGEEIGRGSVGWEDRDIGRRKHDGGGEEKAKGRGRRRMEGWRTEECDHIKYASPSERTLKVAICTSDPMPEAEGSIQPLFTYIAL